MIPIPMTGIEPVTNRLKA
nr:hypothetical protein [Sicyoidochytrium minutum DNA virus]